MIEKNENEYERALSISQNAADLGFDFQDYRGPVEKVREELIELVDAIEDEEQNEMREMDELGDLLFSVLNLARKIGVNPELALRHTNEKFQSRFSYVEKMIKSQGPVDLAQMEVWWVDAKEQETE